MSEVSSLHYFEYSGEFLLYIRFMTKLDNYDDFISVMKSEREAAKDDILKQHFKNSSIDSRLEMNQFMQDAIDFSMSDKDTNHVIYSMSLKPNIKQNCLYSAFVKNAEITEQHLIDKYGQTEYDRLNDEYYSAMVSVV